jgi:uncharacterized membrane protein
MTSQLPAERAGAAANRGAIRMATALFGIGVLHFVAPKPFDSIVPPALPGSARTYTYASGVAEIAVAGALAAPKTRKVGALAAVALFVSVFPANVQMAVDSTRNPNTNKFVKAAVIARLPLQIPMIAAALSVHRNAR